MIHHMNKTLTTLLAILILFTAGGFGFASVPEENTSCKGMGCLRTEDGERDCNSCQTSTPMFTTGMMNITKVCRGTEIIQCNAGVMTKQSIETDEESCTWEWQFFSAQRYP